MSRTNGHLIDKHHAADTQSTAAHEFLELLNQGFQQGKMEDSEAQPKRSLLDGYEPEIFKLVKDHATPEQWREWLRAPLEHAAAKGKTDLFTRLMDAGADGSTGWRGCHGRTLLIAAAHGKSDKVVRRLLTAGAKPEVNFVFDGVDTYDEDACGESALHEAADLGAEAVSRVLLHAGADPNLRDSDEQTPLHVAARKGHHVVADILMLKGANLEARDSSLRTPLHLAAEEGHALCVSELLQGGANHNAWDYDGDTPLFLAAKEDMVDTFEELVAAGADLHARNQLLGMSVLDRAAHNRSMGVVRSILRHGVDITETDSDGITALHRAADGNLQSLDNSGTVRILLKAGADIEAKTNASSTPLDCAVNGQYASSDTILALLEGGAAVNARLALGKTPLHTACRCSNADAVELLLRWGADETLTDEDGRTAGDMVGWWDESDSDDDDGEEYSGDRQHRADDQRIRDMLARAPADRSWRRRGWLVLCRSRPDQVELAVTSNRRRSSANANAKGARMNEGGSVGDGTGGDTVDFARLIMNVVELDADAIFRLVVGFL